MKYNITLYLNNNEGTTEIYKGTVEFEFNPDTYGNGFYMGVTCQTEPFGTQGYDIRYDREFDPKNKIAYIVRFFSERYDGVNRSRRLIGIRVHEAE